MATFFGKNKYIDQQTQKKFKATNKINRFIRIDEKNKLIAISVKDRMKPTYIFKYDNFVDYSIFSNEKEIKGKSGLGRAVGGGLLFGPGGAIVGAITGKKEKDLTINQLLLRIYLKFDDVETSESIPIIIFRKVPINSIEYKDLEKELKEITDFLDTLLPQHNNQTLETNMKQSLIDLKELLDAGIITQDEFNNEKTKILSRS